MKRYAYFGLLLLAGCESDADRLARLQDDAMTARGQVLFYQQTLEELRRTTSNPPAGNVDSIQGLLTDAQTRATLAERELNQYMND